MWKYLDDGSDQGTLWRTPLFDDSGWLSGRTPLGYGDPWISTTVSFGNNAASKHITTYFRRAFTLTQPLSTTLLSLRMLRDDGIVVYLNNVEIFRNNLPTSTLTYTTLASTSIGGSDETTVVQTIITAGLLVTGVNALAAEVHQAAPDSSDLTFDLELIGKQIIPSPPITTNNVLLAVGDIADCASSDDEAVANLVTTLTGTLVTLGDNAYDNGTPTEFANCYHPAWGRHLIRTYPSTGNHDYNTPNAAGYFGYFGAIAGHPTKGYYSLNLQGWHLIALNSNCSFVGGCGVGSPQHNWLLTDLYAHTNIPCTLAYWHHPRFTSGSGHLNDSAYQPFWQALYDAQADVILTGHVHNYERFAPQQPDGAADAARGLRQFVVGTGGRVLYLKGLAIANSEAQIDNSHGILKLILHASSYDWQFINPAGAVLDRGAGTCH